MSNRLRMTRAEKDALAEAIRGMFCYRESKESKEPTVDAVPVKHGQWLEDEKTYPGPGLSNYVCSSCKRVGGTWIKGLKLENLFTYCPWCGAKMDGKEKET